MPLDAAAIIGAVAALIALLPPVVAGISGRRGEFRREFQTYLYSLADGLDEMAAELSQGRVPTGAGNRVEKGSEKFVARVNALPIEEFKKDELYVASSKLRRSVADGRFLDDVIRGKILFSTPERRARVLDDLRRTAAHLRSLADGLLLPS